MARPIRFAPADLPVHVWVRGNQRQDVFFSDADRRRYLDLLARHSQEQRVRVLAYCLMRNHVHLVLQPADQDGLSWLMMRLNSEYAQKTQFRLERSGHLWQGRFRASVMDDAYFWTVLRYVELNPARAGIVRRAEEWDWSSARSHMGLAPWPEWLETQPFCSRFSAKDWRKELKTAITSSERASIWRATRMNRPLASEKKIEAWEAQFAVSLRPGRPGRPMRNWIEQKKARAAGG